MKAHHGQCSAAAVGGVSCNFRSTPGEIATALVNVSEEHPVASILPKCPEHDLIVMFNGCMACGHLFTDTSWRSMPKWDPHAKALLALDKKKRQKATLLAEQIRKEAAMLQFERDALRNAWGGKLDSSIDDLPPLPPPAEDFVGCGPSCRKSHRGDGLCLVCGGGWERHNGHTCANGERGSWAITPIDDVGSDDGDY